MTRPASRASSRGVVRQFLWSLLPRIPPPRGLLYSKHSPKHHSAVPEVTTPYEDSTVTPRSILPTRSKATTSTDLTDHRLQLSKQNPSSHEISYATRSSHVLNAATAPYSSADGYRRKQKSLSTIKGKIRAVMKKSQRVNAITEICMIRTTSYDFHGIYRVRPGPRRREKNGILKANRILKRQSIPSHFKQKLYQNQIL